MANITPTFDLVFDGNGTVTSELWVDLGVIPTGKQLFIGYANLIANDKDLLFEFRPNILTKSLGTVGETNLRYVVSAPKGDSKDVDMFYYGNIVILGPAAGASTGVEKMWLRIKSGTGAAGTFDYMIFYTLY